MASIPRRDRQRPTTAPHTTTRQATVTPHGTVRAGRWTIGVGSQRAGCTTTVVLDDRYATVFTADELIRHLELDPTRNYQPSRRRRGGPASHAT